jgi:hypothetical protein
MRVALAVALAAIATATFCFSVVVLHALATPTRPQAEFAKSWARNTRVVQSSALDFTRPAQRAVQAF